MEIKNTRPYEAIVVAAAFVVYVVQRLFDERAHLAELENVAVKAGISHEQMLGSWPGISYDVNTVLPIIGGAILLLSAWLIFHLLVVPQAVSAKPNNNKLLLFSGASILLIFLSLFLYYGLKLYVPSVRIIEEGPDGGITISGHSFYRKKTVLGDAIGIAFLFVFFELVSAVFRKMQLYFLKENLRLFKLIAYVLPLIPALNLFTAALSAHIPTPLWSDNIQLVLLWISSLVMVWVLQEHIVRYLLPNYKEPTSVVLTYLFTFTLVFLAGNTLIWAANSNFYFYNYPTALFHRAFLLQLIRTLFPAIVFAIFRKAVLKEKIVLQQQVAGTSAELAQLRSQINPHFLFNALNSLYAAAMKEGAEKAADGIQRLGDMMRFMLQENNQERISVTKEIEYLHNYIHLQRIRIDETQGIEIKVILNHPDNDVYIAPMMLIPFVENAFKHGISHRSPSWIFITLSFDATRLYFRVQNSRHIRKETDPEECQSGIGLQNVEKRLQLLYPARHTLHIQQSDHDYIASLTLSLW